MNYFNSFIFYFVSHKLTEQTEGPLQPHTTAKLHRRILNWEIVLSWFVVCLVASLFPWCVARFCKCVRKLCRSNFSSGCRTLCYGRKSELCLWFISLYQTFSLCLTRSRAETSWHNGQSIKLRTKGWWRDWGMRSNPNREPQFMVYCTFSHYLELKSLQPGYISLYDIICLVLTAWTLAWQSALWHVINVNLWPQTTLASTDCVSNSFPLWYDFRPLLSVSSGELIWKF